MGVEKVIFKNNQAPQCEDKHLNAFVQELNNAIESQGIASVPDNWEQLADAISQASMTGTFFDYSGTANAIILTQQSGKSAPKSYYNGMRVLFNATRENSGATTVNVAGLGVKNITKPDGSAVDAKSIFGYSEIIFNATDDRFELNIATTGGDKPQDLLARYGIGNHFQAWNIEVSGDQSKWIHVCDLDVSQGARWLITLNGQPQFESNIERGSIIQIALTGGNASNNNNLVGFAYVDDASDDLGNLQVLVGSPSGSQAGLWELWIKTDRYAEFGATIQASKPNTFTVYSLESSVSEPTFPTGFSHQKSVRRRLTNDDLSDAIDSTSSTQAGSSAAVKIAYDLAQQALNAANSASSSVRGKVGLGGEQWTSFRDTNGEAMPLVPSNSVVTRGQKKSYDYRIGYRRIT